MGGKSHHGGQNCKMEGDPSEGPGPACATLCFSTQEGTEAAFVSQPPRWVCRLLCSPLICLQQ